MCFASKQRVATHFIKSMFCQCQEKRSFKLDCVQFGDDVGDGAGGGGADDGAAPASACKKRKQPVC